MSKSFYFKIILGILPVLFLILLIFKSGLAPIKTLNRLEQVRTITTKDSTYLTTPYDSLVRLYTYKHALLELASEDSIQLIMNLPDSQAILSLHGVPIFVARLEVMTLDPFLKKLPFKTYAENFYQPLPIVSTESTIVKEPIVERQAPKDTTEAALNAYMPDTLIQNPAFVKFSLENGINVFFEQTPNRDNRVKWARRTFYFHHRKERVSDLFESMLTNNPYEYQPRIVVRLKVEDLRAIYRALPNKSGKVVITY